MFESISWRNPGWVGVVVLGGLFYLAGQYIASQPQRLQQEVEANREISVQGTGEVSSQPDVARLNLGVQIEAQPTAKQALEQLAAKITTVMESLEAAGIKSDDIKTSNVSVNPVYDFQTGRTLRGFEANEMVTVTIRDLDRVGEVLMQATTAGANQAGGISFEVDDLTGQQAEAQTKAIQDARSKAERLAKALGVRLGAVKSFKVDSSELPIFARAEAGIGGDSPLPVPPGIQQLKATVTITFELR